MKYKSCFIEGIKNGLQYKATALFVSCKPYTII